jgi:hypothetical protein
MSTSQSNKTRKLYQVSFETGANNKTLKVSQVAYIDATLNPVSFDDFYNEYKNPSSGASMVVGVGVDETTNTVIVPKLSVNFYNGEDDAVGVLAKGSRPNQSQLQTVNDLFSASTASGSSGASGASTGAFSGASTASTTSAFSGASPANVSSVNAPVTGVNTNATTNTNNNNINSNPNSNNNIVTDPTSNSTVNTNTNNSQPQVDDEDAKVEEAKQKYENALKQFESYNKLNETRLSTYLTKNPISNIKTKSEEIFKNIHEANDHNDNVLNAKDSAEKINLYNEAANLYNTSYNNYVTIMKKIPPPLIKRAAKTVQNAVNAFKVNDQNSTPVSVNNQPAQPGGGKRATASKRPKRRKTIKHRRHNNH